MMKRIMYAKNNLTLEAQLPIYWVPVLGSLYELILAITQEPTIWVPGLLGLCRATLLQIVKAIYESLQTAFCGFAETELMRTPVGCAVWVHVLVYQG